MDSSDDNYDQLEAQDLECYNPHKNDQDVKEEILVEDENMIVGQITSMEEYDVPKAATNGQSIQTLHNVTKLPPHAAASRIVQNPVMRHNGNNSEEAVTQLGQFTEVEDLIIHALDTVSPFDAKFISDHMTKRDEQSIEKRLNELDFRKLSFSFQKLPILMFEVVFVNEGILRSRSLMLLTQKQLISLKCKHEACLHGPGVETLQLGYRHKDRFGVDTGQLCEFIITNIPNKHMPYLRRNVHQLEAFMEASKINFHKSAVSTFTRKDMKEVSRHAVTLESIKKTGVSPIRIDGSGKLNLKKEHEDTLKKIVKAVGKPRWEEVSKLLLAVYDHEVDYDVEDEEIYDRVARYYQLKLDPDLEIGVFTEDEDKCIIFMHKYWSKCMEEEDLWSHIARHMMGRTAQQVKNRFLRTTKNPTDLTLENIQKYPFDPKNPATFNNDLAHIFALTVIPKSTSIDMEITTKLQHEVRFLVMGTKNEIFLVPCKDTAIRCTHSSMIHNNFTYDPARPPQQFVTYIKLTFTNGLKKAGLIEDPDNFHFSDIVYKGDGIHPVMLLAESERFIVPKEQFMQLNRKQEGDITTEMVLPLKRKYTKRTDRQTLPHPERLKVKIQPPSAKRRIK
eukprot:GFUD01043146.1.p1 GENE.GFUD01043146.1~~GFUD01043146.1.p1  ORF type:complete len:618 (-),score=188.28 GFUD01043146.1:78-1931(-)